MARLHYMDKKNIERVIEELAYSRVKRFYPTIVSKATGLSLNSVFEYLLELIIDGRLIIQWEIRCHHYDCNGLIKRTENIDQYIGKFIECPECEREVFINENLVFPVFSITDNFREDVREERKKKVPSLLKAL